jgi:hypothetical protein
LVKRRAMLAGELDAAEAGVQRLRADLAALDAVILQLDPDYPVDAIRAKRRRARSGAGFAVLSRAVLDALRDAKRPMLTAEVAERVIAVRGLDGEDRAVRAAMATQAGRALRGQRVAGAVRIVRWEGKCAVWELAE